jgi:uncharacterized membrane protein YdbT with pleckstrin-like domain
MPYVDSILEPNEHVVFRTSVSWTVYGSALLLAILAIAALVAGNAIPPLFVVCAFLCIVLALGALASFLRAWFRRWTTEIAITDRRLVFKRGFIRRHTVEMNMQKVESVDVDQTRLGRLFNYGSVTVRGVGASLETFYMIDAPLELRSKITAG